MFSIIKKGGLFLIIVVTLATFGRFSFSYNDTITHPALTDNVADVYNANNPQKLNDQQINWLKQGSIEEDVAPRWVNHFYDPQTNSGLWSFLNSKNWAQSPSAQAAYVFSDGDQTWQQAIESYAKGDEKSAFLALGHVLHLLEDATVPAHTRLDAHPEGDPYESWVKESIGEKINFDVQPVNVSDLSSAFDSLAIYSNKYFFSKDTIEIEKDKNIIQINRDGVSYECVGKIIDGKNICLAIYIKSKFGQEEYFLDISEKISVHSDYFSLLAPRAVAYGAGVVELFFEEAEKRKQEEQNKSWWEKIKDASATWLLGASDSLYAGLPEPFFPSGQSLAGSEESAASSLEDILVQETNISLPPDKTVVAGEIFGGPVNEQLSNDNQIPSEILEDKNPSQAILPSQSPFIIPQAISPTPQPTPASENDSNQEEETPSPTPTPTEEPETTITFGPDSFSSTTTAVFIFESSKTDATFLCQLDDASSTDCVSPKEFSGLSEGNHVFKVVAISDEQADLTPAQYSWAIDIGAPQISNIISSPARTSVLISWNCSEPAIFQIEYGTTTDYGFFSATTTSISLSLDLLKVKTGYHFRILAQDDFGNVAASSDYDFSTTAQAENVVISEIQISGASANDEFVELYNPTDRDINLDGWKLARRTASVIDGYSSNLVTKFPDKIIPAHSYFLIAHSLGYDGLVVPDLFYTSTSSSYIIAANNALILYSDAGDTIVDMVGFGNASSSEKTTIENPGANQSVERKSMEVSTADSLFSGIDKWQGNGYDSDDNSQDFVLQPNPSPQNSLMLAEPRTSLPKLMEDSAWPTWQRNLARQGFSNASSLATSSMTIKWMATSTLGFSFSSRPALDSEDNIYIGVENGLAKFSSAGELLWLNASSTSVTAPLILSDGTIVIRGLGELADFTSDGRLKWKVVLSGGAGPNAHPALLSDGTILAQAGNQIYAINQDATLKWVFNFGRALSDSNSISALVIDCNNNIYFAADNYLYAVSPAGSLIWENNIVKVNYSSIALGDDGILYFSGKDQFPLGGFYLIDKNTGSVIGADESGYGLGSQIAPAIDSAGNVFNVFIKPNVKRDFRAYKSATTTPFWIMDNIVSSTLAAPVVTGDNKIYVADQKSIKIFDATNGQLDGVFNSSDDRYLYQFFGAIGKDGTIYTANTYALYAIGG